MNIDNRPYGGLRAALNVAAAAAAALVLYSCASIGNPSGGPVDEDPPRFVRASPAPGSVEVEPHSVTIDFNELVNVKDAFSKVVISPPSSQTARVSANGKRLTVQLPDSLAPNTTYTIDFNDAIEDVNEGNRLEGFTYTFSTGAVLDSMRVSGIVLDASSLEPRKEVLVGVHSILADSAFRTLPFERIAKTDERGRFTIRGMKPGPYRIFALADANNDFRWDNPEEDIAFYDEIIVPQAEPAFASDTIYNLRTGAIDTVMTRGRTRFLPNDLLLAMFNSGYRQQYAVTKERVDSTRIRLIFNAPSPAPARLTPIGFDAVDWYDLERSATNDTLTFWLRDPALISTDTLRMRVDFDGFLSDGTVSTQTDSIDFITQRPKARPAKKKKDDKEKAPEEPLLGLDIQARPVIDIDEPIYLTTPQPLESLYASAIHLDKKVDSLWTVAPGFDGTLIADTLSLLKYSLPPIWEYGGEYRLRVDTLAARSIYGLSSRPLERTFKVKPENEYCRFAFNISGIPPGTSAFVELLNGSDKPVRTAPVAGNTATFANLNPGTYYARLILDTNGNGKFDPGNYDKGLQPEIVSYYPKRLNLKKGWDTSQSWNILDTPVDMQKPEAVKKNKPTRNRKGKQNQTTETEEEEDEIFDPTRNPFDPNDKGRRRTTAGSY